MWGFRLPLITGWGGYLSPPPMGYKKKEERNPPNFLVPSPAPSYGFWGKKSTDKPLKKRGFSNGVFKPPGFSFHPVPPPPWLKKALEKAPMGFSGKKSFFGWPPRRVLAPPGFLSPAKKPLTFFFVLGLPLDVINLGV